MKIMFAAVGSRGDVQPMIALALEARQRGHHVQVGAPPDCADWVRSHGLEFSAIGSDIQAWLKSNADVLSGNPLTMLRGMQRYFATELPRQFPALAAAARGCDALVVGGLAFAGSSVAELLGMPLLAVAYSGCVLPSAQHPPPMIPWQGLVPWANRCLWWLNARLANPMIDAAVNAGRQLIGLAPINFCQTLIEQIPTLFAVDAAIFPPDPAWGGRHTYANFIHYPDPAPLDANLQAWLDDGAAPIYVGFGSMSGPGTARVNALLHDALRDSGHRVLVSAGWGDLGTGALPPHWRQVGVAPHALLFPRTALVIHHGGSGTMANALRAGVPQVLLPLILDQFYHAQRLYQAGLAPKPTPMEKVTAQRLADAVAAALCLPPELRRAASERLLGACASRQIIERLETGVAATAAQPSAAAG